jgi:hypothetical protein
MAIDLNLLFGKLSSDKKLRPSHLSLAVAIAYVASNDRSGQQTFKISRKTLMTLSKINSITTYHKTIRDLCAVGLIIYTPSFDPRKCSEIRLL